jgi:hypothetical protein
MTHRTEDHFLAIVEEARNDPKAMPTYQVYFVNASHQPIAGVTHITGGYTSSDDELLHATGQRCDLGPVAAETAVVIGSEDAGSFDFTVWWEMELSFEDGPVVTQTFSVPKWFPMRPGSARRCRVPVMDVEGWVVPAKTAPQ